MDVRKADNPERLKDLRVVDKHLTLEQLAEQTGLSKSALGKYETDDYKDISPFAIATLADFYGVSTDYLMGLTENKNHPNTELQSLHLSDDMVELLSSGKINNRLLCELATHPNFRRLMIDMEICIDQIANMRVEQMNLVLEATRQTVMSKYAPGEDDLYMRTLELGQVQESDFYSHVMHDDLDSIVRDIREAHRKDKTTADPQPTIRISIEEKIEQAIGQGSDTEMLIHEFCDKLQIPFEKISSEDFSAFLRILSLSKQLKSPNNMRGKASPIPLPTARPDVSGSEIERQKSHPPVDWQMAFVKLYSVVVVVPSLGTALLKMLFFVFLRHLRMGFLLDKQPRRKAVFEVAFVFLTLSDCHLLPQFFNQCIVLFAQTLR